MCVRDYRHITLKRVLTAAGANRAWFSGTLGNRPLARRFRNPVFRFGEIRVSGENAPGTLPGTAGMFQKGSPTGRNALHRSDLKGKQAGFESVPL